MSTEYRTLEPGKVFTGEYVEKKSRFIANITGAGDEAYAREFINGIKKKHYDARHNVSAYILRSGDGTPDRQHSTDDGEPPGTAGKPVLDILNGEELTDVVMVVTRYFGGTLLGTGGLVRAYSTAAKEAIAKAEIVQMRPAAGVSLNFSYASEGGIRRLMEKFSAVLTNSEYGEKVGFLVHVPEENLEAFEKALTENFSGQVVSSVGEVEFFPCRVYSKKNI